MVTFNFVHRKLHFLFMSYASDCQDEFDDLGYTRLGEKVRGIEGKERAGGSLHIKVYCVTHLQYKYQVSTRSGS